MTSVRENQDALMKMFPQLNLVSLIQNHLDWDLQKARLSEGCMNATLQLSSPTRPKVVQSTVLTDSLSLLVTYFKEQAREIASPLKNKTRNFEITGIDVVGFLADEFSWIRIPGIRALYRAAPNLVGLLISCFFFNNSLSSLPCFTPIRDYYLTQLVPSCLNMASHLLIVPRSRVSLNDNRPPEIVAAVEEFEKKLLEIAASNPKPFEGLLWKRGYVTDLLPKYTVFECLVCDEEIPIENAFSCKFVGRLDIAADNVAVPGSSKAVQKSKEHMFCINCIRGQAKASVTEALLDPESRGIKCMASDCKNPILYEKIKAYLPRSIRALLEQRIADQNICTALENLERCTKCGFPLEMEVPKEVNKVFKCLSCDYEYCRFCHLNWEKHFGLTCKEAEVRTGDALRKQTCFLCRICSEIKLNEAIIRKCPSCHLAFVKESQCNKMKCRCGMTMCYICRAVKIDYNHFCNHVRDPKVPNCIQCTTKRCLLWEDYRKYDEEAKKKVLQEQSSNVPADKA